MLTGLLLWLLDRLLTAIHRGAALVLARKDDALRLWNQSGALRLPIGAIDFLLDSLRALERYLERVRRRLRYRAFFEQLTAPMGERYRHLRRG